MGTMTFDQARASVIERVRAAAKKPPRGNVRLEDAAGRILAQDVRADRDYPPLDRSIRDGFAVRSADTPGRLSLCGEVRAGEAAEMTVGRGETAEIMTGAPMPAGADAVVMVEHAQREGEIVRVPGAVAGQFVNPRGSEARSGQVLLEAGQLIGFAEIALLATVGCESPEVFARPRVAIAATGDEIVEAGTAPLDHQIRNSNARSLAAQVRRAGGEPVVLPVARDTPESTRAIVEKGLRADLLLLSGGVSAGKYDVVERVLAELGAEFYFDRVLIQPGQPLVFGRADGTFFFGLPGNPVSTMVTFEIFARAAVELLAGRIDAPLPVTLARLETDFNHKRGLTRFLPARLGPDGTLAPVKWQGSGDVPAVCRTNAFLVADAERASWKAGELVSVLIR